MLSSLWLIICATWMQVVRGELFTALVDLEGLLVTERELINNINAYLQAEEEKLHRVKRFLMHYQTLHEEASKNAQDFLANPVNAYLLVKRLTKDWRAVESVMSENVGQSFVQNITGSEVLRFPDDEDLSGAAIALIRLQDTYKLETGAIAKGHLQGAQLSQELTAGDCFELGRQTYNSGDHYHTVLWMQEALKRFHEEDMPTIAREDILEYLAFSTYMQGKTEEALQLTDELLKLMPHHPRAPGNKIYYEEELVKLKKTRKGDDGSPNISAQPELTPSEDAEPEEEEESERSVYEKLCRGEVSPSPKILASTYCTYFDHNRHPLLVIGPLKLEVMYPKPWIVIFRNFLQENEMEIIKQLAQPRLKRATVQNYKSGELETATYRISKSAWLRTEEHPVIEKIVRRIDAATDLDVETAEELQVVNYGLGGHYEPHFDFARREEKNAFKSLGTGNRIATWLNYMSDVSAGGATVFPELRLSLWPQKGSSAFWFNLHKSGEGDMKTRHAACPVLAGSKWVSNKWFHERGQEFRRPCGLSPDE